MSKREKSGWKTRDEEKEVRRKGNKTRKKTHYTQPDEVIIPL